MFHISRFFLPGNLMGIVTPPWYRPWGQLLSVAEVESVHQGARSAARWSQPLEAHAVSMVQGSQALVQTQPIQIENIYIYASFQNTRFLIYPFRSQILDKGKNKPVKIQWSPFSMANIRPRNHAILVHISQVNLEEHNVKVDTVR